MHKRENTKKSHSFWLYLFLGAFVSVGTKEFEISMKFCVFLITIWTFFPQKIFWGHNSIICKLLTQMCKKLCIFQHIAKG
jgi:hypothetical protein